MPERNRGEFDNSSDTDFAHDIPGTGALPLQRHARAQGMRGRLPHHPGEGRQRRAARHLRGGAEALLPHARARARHGSDGLGQVDDALLAHRSHQPQAQRARDHDRRSDRVRAREQAVHHHAAAGGRAHRLVQDGAARRAARGSRHRARRRAARSRDRVDRDRDGRDGTPRVRDAAHDVGGGHDRSPHRSVPAGPPGAGARDACRSRCAA